MITSSKFHLLAKKKPSTETNENIKSSPNLKSIELYVEELVCPLCSKDIHSLSTDDRDFHIDRCLDSALMSHTNSNSNISFWKEIPLCPCCDKLFGQNKFTLTSKILHMKICGKKNGLSVVEIVEMVSQRSIRKSKLSLLSHANSCIQSEQNPISDLNNPPVENNSSFTFELDDNDEFKNYPTVKQPKKPFWKLPNSKQKQFHFSHLISTKSNKAYSQSPILTGDQADLYIAHKINHVSRQNSPCIPIESREQGLRKISLVNTERNSPFFEPYGTLEPETQSFTNDKAVDQGDDTLECDQTQSSYESVEYTQISDEAKIIEDNKPLSPVYSIYTNESFELKTQAIPIINENTDHVTSKPINATNLYDLNSIAEYYDSEIQKTKDSFYKQILELQNQSVYQINILLREKDKRIKDITGVSTTVIVSPTEDGSESESEIFLTRSASPIFEDKSSHTASIITRDNSFTDDDLIITSSHVSSLEYKPPSLSSPSHKPSPCHSNILKNPFQTNSYFLEESDNQLQLSPSLSNLLNRNYESSDISQGEMNESEYDTQSKKIHQTAALNSAIILPKNYHKLPLKDLKDLAAQLGIKQTSKTFILSQLSQIQNLGLCTVEGQEPNDPETKQLVYQFLKDNDEIWSRIVCYEPLVFNDIHLKLVTAGIKCSKKKLVPILDSMGIHYINDP